ncbi:MAG TPA: hypothetical protein VM032_18420 [Vicinamibacterales bacterium]|nr:hypothetical protein [Vicinamibacterales bacterium]
MTAERLRASWPYLAYAAIALWYCAPLFTSADGLGTHDWDQHLFYYGSVIKSVFEYGQLPFWNPWYCGGNVLWQNPQIPLVSPVFPLALVVSLPLAMKINIALHYWIGLAGMHLLLTSSIGVRDRAAAIGLSAIAVCSGAMAMHLAVGHSVFLPVLYLPLQLHFLIRAIRGGAVRDAAYASLPLAFMVYNGALHAVPMSVAGVGVFCVSAAIARRRLRPLAVGLLVGVLGLSYAAPKLLPVALFVTSDRFVDARTTIEHPDAMSAAMVVRAYLDRYQNRGLQFPHQRSGWYEYGNYIGGVAALVMLASIVVALAVPCTRDRWLGAGLAITAVAFLLLSAGEFSPVAPASLARVVPLFSSFRIPSRYTFAFVLFGAAAAGWAWRAVTGDGGATRAGSTALAVVAALAVLDVAVQTREQLAGVFSLRPLDRRFRIGAGPRTPPPTDTTTSAYGPDSPMLHGLLNDTTFWGCYESLQLKRTASPDRAMVEADGASRIFDVQFSPNRIDFAVAAGREATVVRMNQNAAAGWDSTLGKVVPDPVSGMHAVLRPGQAGRYSFQFRPPGLYTGLLVALLALAASVRWRHAHLADR